MKAEVDAFVSVYDEAVRLVGLHNGKNDEGVLKYALQMYKDSHENKDFQSLHVLNALKEAPNKRMVGSHSGKNDEDVLKYALQMKEYPEEAPNEKVGRLDDPMKSTRDMFRSTKCILSFLSWRRRNWLWNKKKLSLFAKRWLLRRRLNRKTQGIKK